MFYYFGRKKRIAHLYPPPNYSAIVEPFAGSAAYSLHGNNWERNVKLCDTNQRVIACWKYLQRASTKDINSLPELCIGDKTTDFKQLSQEERDLIGFHINPGSSIPKITCVLFSRWNAGKKYILESIHKIKHWDIILGSYEDMPNQKATWFIDPPYQKMGKHYSGKCEIDFKSLGDWCVTRSGQIIVCESDGADWLPFKFLADTKNVGKRHSKEVIYARD